MNPSKDKKKFSDEGIDEILSRDGEQEKWESGELGQDPRFASISEKPTPILPPDPPTSIRLSIQMRESLKKLFEEEGLKYQTYIRMILTKHINKKLKRPPKLPQ
jgi:predicted DNA binding CopG/RHH family protein